MLAFDRLMVRLDVAAGAVVGLRRAGGGGVAGEVAWHALLDVLDVVGPVRELLPWRGDVVDRVRLSTIREGVVRMGDVVFEGGVLGWGDVRALRRWAGLVEGMGLARRGRRVAGV